MTDRSSVPVVAVAVAVAVTVGGCGIPRDDAPLHTLTVSPGPTAPDEPGQTYEVLPPPPPVSWDGGRLSVTTYGSSSCPSGPTDVDVVGDQELDVWIEPLFPDRDPCTADMAPRTTEVELPDGVSSAEELTVRLRYGDEHQETVVLPPAGN